MRILCDIDSVLADILAEAKWTNFGALLHPQGPWLRKYNEEYGDHLTKADIVKWEISEIVKPECGKDIFKYLREPDFYEGCPEVPGASQGVQLLREMGHDVTFLSAGIYPGKIKWLYDHGFLLPCRDWHSAQDVTLTFQKERFQGDVIIDDCPDNIGDRPGILLDQPWNRDADLCRAMNWAQVIDLIASNRLFT